MPPNHVHFNGGVNLGDVETVMREISRHVPVGVRRIPDGEPGERQQWIFFQGPKFLATQGLESVGTTDMGVNYGEFEQMRIADGVEPADLGWPNLGYADAYIESFQIFQKLKSQDVIPAPVRFQAEYPTPLAGVSIFVVPDDQDRVESSYAPALFADVDRFLATVSHDEVAIQWDVAFETIKLMLGDTLPTPTNSFDSIMERLARGLDHIPDDVPAGVHLCYGDFGHRHIAEPDSLDLQVRMANGISDKTKRVVSWIAFTVPQYQKDPAYFAPLKDLRVRPDTELNFALVPYHPAEQEPGTTAAQARLVEENLAARTVGGGASEWGICTECGMARAERDDVPQLLDLHRQILAEYGNQEVK